MFERRLTQNKLVSAAQIAELMYHNTVRAVRKTHGNAFVAIGLNLLQGAMLVLMFMVMFQVLGMRSNAIRGDYLLYIMSGVFIYMTHVRTVRTVVGAEGPTAAMMKHAPMTTAIAITSEALGALYIQVLTAVVALSLYHTAWTPLVIADPVGAFSMVLLSWFSGFAVGMLLIALKPWAPDFVPLIMRIYTRANMFASGKMFVANQLPAHMLVFFDWNPLFHIIDQTRGFAFDNYFPHHSAIDYAVYVSLGLLMLGLMWEFYTRQSASVSWGARR